MPSKNKNIIRRSKTRKQHRSRKHKRNNNNNNNARNQTIRGGWRWPWRKPTPSSLMDRIKQKNPEFEPVLPPNPRSSQPRLPTNVDAVATTLREGVSKEKRDLINALTKHKEPLIKQRDELVVNKDLLEERLNQENRLEHRNQIRENIAKIKTKIRSIEKNIRAISREIERTQKQDVKYRKDHGLPPLPSDDEILLDADAEMEKVDDVADVFGLGLDKKAVGAEAVLHVRAKDLQHQLDEVMSGVSGSPRDSVETQRSQINKVVDEVTRGVSKSRSDSSARGSSARGSPLPPPDGLPSGRRARGSSVRSPSP